MTKYVASTLSNSVDYTLYEVSKNVGEMPRPRASVLVEGGANVANKKIVTPQGVITRISDEEAGLLEQNEVFKLHKANGYVQILDSAPKNADDAAADMTGREPAAPLVDADFEAAGTPAPNHTGKRK